MDIVKTVRDEIQLDLNFKKKQTRIESYSSKLSSCICINFIELLIYNIEGIINLYDKSSEKLLSYYYKY